MTSTVHTAREIFWACLRAQCTPGTCHPLPADGAGRPVGGRAGATASALLRALVDHRVSVAGAAGATGLAGEIARLTGAALTEPHRADFVVTDADPAALLPTLRRGTPTAPETGATLVVIDHGTTTEVTLAGPGLAAPVRTTLALGGAAVVARNTVVADAPAGVDLFLTSADGVVALPRSSVVEVD